MIQEKYPLNIVFNRKESFKQIISLLLTNKVRLWISKTKAIEIYNFSKECEKK